MGRVERKSVFERAPNGLSRLTPRMRKVLSGHLLFIGAFYSVQWFCERTAKALIRLRGCAVWSGPLLSAYARKTHFFMARPIYFHIKMHSQYEVLSEFLCLYNVMVMGLFTDNKLFLKEISEIVQPTRRFYQVGEKSKSSKSRTAYR